MEAGQAVGRWAEARGHPQWQSPPLPGPQEGQRHQLDTCPARGSFCQKLGRGPNLPAPQPAGFLLGRLRSVFAS